MTSIADIIRIPFGYMLEFLYNFSGNYGLALILFGIAIKLILLPVSAKSKKSMMKMSRMAPRVKALEAKYGDDKTKYQMEVMKLYKKEGVSTTGGCLWAFVPLLILIPLYQVIREPMVYMMHLSREEATEIVNVISQHVNLGSNSYYHQLAAASYLGEYVNEVKAAVLALANVDLSPINFSFLGVNLGKIPTWQFWTLTGWAELIASHGMSQLGRNSQADAVGLGTVAAAVEHQIDVGGALSLAVQAAKQVIQLQRLGKFHGISASYK